MEEHLRFMGGVDMKRFGFLVAALLFLAIVARPLTARAAGELTVTCDRAEAEVGETITWHLSFANWDETPACAFFLYRDLSLLSYTPPEQASLYAFTPDAPGSYSLVIVARDGSGSVRASGGSVDVSFGAPVIASVTASRPEIRVGDTATWTCDAVGAKAYGFFVYRDGEILTLLIPENGASNVVSYTPTEPGTYTVQVLAANAAGKTKAAGAPVAVTQGQGAALSLTGVSASVSEARVGDEIAWTAFAAGGAGEIAFTFFVYRDGELLSMHATGSSGVFHYVPAEPGVYQVSVHAGSGLESANLAGGAVTVADSEGVRLSGVDASAWKVVLGSEVMWTARPENASDAATYAFAVYRDGAFAEFIETGANPVLTYRPAWAGTYSAVAFASDGGHAASAASGDTKVVDAVLAVDSVSADALSFCVGETITWTVSASGSDNLQYMYIVYCDADQVAPAVTSSEPTFSYVPDQVGQVYSIAGLVSDGTQTADFSSAPVRTFAAGTPHILSITPDKEHPGLGEPILWTVEVANPAGVAGYQYTLFGKSAGIVSETGWLTENTFLCAPTEPDEYTLTVELSADPWGFLNLATAYFRVREPASLDFAAVGALSDAVAPALSALPERIGTPAPTLSGNFEIIVPKVNFPLATTRPPMAPSVPKATPTPAPTINPGIFQPSAFRVP
jgi:hypothetical protein